MYYISGRASRINEDAPTTLALEVFMIASSKLPHAAYSRGEDRTRKVARTAGDSAWDAKIPCPGCAQSRCILDLILLSYCEDLNSGAPGGWR